MNSLTTIFPTEILFKIFEFIPSDHFNIAAACKELRSIVIGLCDYKMKQKGLEWIIKNNWDYIIIIHRNKLDTHNDKLIYCLCKYGRIRLINLFERRCKLFTCDLCYDYYKQKFYGICERTGSNYSTENVQELRSLYKHITKSDLCEAIYKNCILGHLKVVKLLLLLLRNYGDYEVSNTHVVNGMIYHILKYRGSMDVFLYVLEYFMTPYFISNNCFLYAIFKFYSNRKIYIDKVKALEEHYLFPYNYILDDHEHSQNIFLIACYINAPEIIKLYLPKMREKTIARLRFAQYGLIGSMLSLNIKLTKIMLDLGALVLDRGDTYCAIIPPILIKVKEHYCKGKSTDDLLELIDIYFSELQKVLIDNEHYRKVLVDNTIRGSIERFCHKFINKVITHKIRKSFSRIEN